jgi:hypothetical protein
LSTDEFGSDDELLDQLADHLANRLAARLSGLVPDRREELVDAREISARCPP